MSVTARERLGLILLAAISLIFISVGIVFSGNSGDTSAPQEREYYYRQVMETERDEKLKVESVESPDSFSLKENHTSQTKSARIHKYRKHTKKPASDPQESSHRNYLDERIPLE